MLPVDGVFWLNFLLLNLGGTTFATTIYFIAIKKLGANSASTFVFLVPFFALVFWVILLQESLPLYSLVGAVLSIGSLVFLSGIKFFHTNRR
jgi:drug/metabolite transporter (DMT)-like permease